LLSKVNINGEILDWDEGDFEEEFLEVPNSDVEKLKAEGYVNSKLVYREVKGYTSMRLKTFFKDGTIQLLAKSDWKGRLAANGGHTNYGYSGYFKLYIFVEGKRKTLKNGWMLFPNKEHYYEKQDEKGIVTERIESIVKAHTGRSVLKVKGGWEIDFD